MQTQNREKKVKEGITDIKNKLNQNVFYPQPDSHRRNEEKFRSVKKTSASHHAPVQTRSRKTLSYIRNSNPRAKAPAHMAGMDRLSLDSSATQDPQLHQVMCNSNINSTTHWNINPILHFLRISNQCRLKQVNVPKEDDQLVQGVLDSFAKLRKMTISFVMAVRPSVHMEQLGSYWKNFH
jgi:hypothetical protein